MEAVEDEDPIKKERRISFLKINKIKIKNKE